MASQRSWQGRVLWGYPRSRCLLIFVFLALPLSATTYYVDKCVTVGSDSNNGTSIFTPWLTINKVNTSSFNPGDSVLFQRTCIWREQLVPPSSGSAGSPIIFGAYGSGAKPILNGSSLVSSWTLYSGSIYSAAVSWNPNMVFQDGALLTIKTSTGAMTPGSYYATGTTLYIWTTDSSNPSGHTIEASHYPAGPPGNGNINAGLVDITKSYITLDGLDIKYANYYGVRLHIANNVTVQNSSFEYGYHNAIAPDEAGVTNSANLSVLNNTFSHTGVIRSRGCCEGVAIDITGIQTGTFNYNAMDAGFAENIQVNGGASNIVIRGNRVTNAINYGIYLSQGYNLGGDTTNVVISYNNVTLAAAGTVAYEIALEVGSSNIDGFQVYGNIGSCGTYNSYGLIFGFNHPGGTIKNGTVVNNTFYCPNGNGIYAGGPTTDASNVIKNNIIYAYNAWTLADTEANYSPDYNVLYSANPSPINWNGTSYSVATFKTAKGKMMNSVQANPLFASAGTGNFSLLAGSPAIDAGTNLGTTYQMGLNSSSSWPSSVSLLDQNSYGLGWEIGAFIHGPATAAAPAAPTGLTATVR